MMPTGVATGVMPAVVAMVAAAMVCYGRGRGGGMGHSGEAAQRG